VEASRLVADADGSYVVAGNVVFDIDRERSGSRVARLVVNGSATIAEKEISPHDLGPTGISIAATAHLKAGDAVELVVEQDSGQQLRVVSQATRPIDLMMVRLQQEVAVADGPTGLAGAFGTSLATQVRQTSSWQVDPDESVSLGFDAAENDRKTMFDPTQRTRLTAPVAGTYLILGEATFSADPNGPRQLSIVLNGQRSVGWQSVGPPKTRSTRMDVATLRDLAAGDYVELRVLHQARKSLAIRSGEHGPGFMMIRVD
jgi:hypothetical protein